MTGPCFVDTNVLVHANDVSAGHKQAVAFDLVGELIENERLVLSAQVLNELAAVLLRPRFGFTLDQTREALGLYAHCPLVNLDATLTRRALDVCARYQLSLWDGLIVAAAERGRCREILSEDLNHGQEYFGIVVRNPFLNVVSEPG
ncbi:MAG: PIN domain-containing protein [Xanthomonadales bacterium]|nr:tRNA(fMet)-specific endonuclease VapC [Xanthomonadales bacterium]MCC6594053.1 PIN domain-containing protein [Xanthomonadales bacterium]